jgi:hypothetical protein
MQKVVGSSPISRFVSLIQGRHADAMLEALAAAPADAEESTLEEEGAARDSLAGFRSGEEVSPDQLKRRFTLDVGGRV